MLASVIVAIVAACCFATGNAIQHRAAGRIPSGLPTVALIGRLFRSRQWILGSSLAFSGFLLHVLALNLGVVAVVQPFLVGAVLLAVPIRAFLDRARPSRSELGWVALTVVGIIAFVSAARSERSGSTPDDQQALSLTIAGFLVGLVLAGLSTKVLVPRAKALVLASASGLVFGVTAGLMKFVRYDLDQGLTYFVSHWHLWALLIGSLIGTTLNQRSYQAADLAASMPAMNTVDIIMAVAFAWVVFNEPPSSSPGALAIQLAALVVTSIGLLQVARAEDAATSRPAVAPSTRS